MDYVIEHEGNMKCLKINYEDALVCSK